MSTNPASNILSLSRPSDPEKLYESTGWQYYVGPGLALAGVMMLMVFFVVSAVMSGWVSDISNPSEADPASLLARVRTYDAWLFPIATASIGLIKVGIAIILFGIVRRLWVRVESVKESLPALTKRSSESVA